MATTKIFHELQEIKRKVKLIHRKIGSAKLSYPQACQCCKESAVIVDEVLSLNAELCELDPFEAISYYGKESAYIFKILRTSHFPLPKKFILSELKKFEIHSRRIEYCLELLRKTGEIYEPKKGFFRRI